MRKSNGARLNPHIRMPKFVSFDESGDARIFRIDEDDFGMHAFFVYESRCDEIGCVRPFRMIKSVTVGRKNCLNEFSRTVRNQNKFVRRIIFADKFAAGFASEIEEENALRLIGR